MSETSRRWYVVHYKSKDDPSLGVNYTFGEKVAESAFFPTEQAAWGILSLMRPGVTFALADGQTLMIHDFAVEKVDDSKYAIYTTQEIPADLVKPISHSKKG